MAATRQAFETIRTGGPALRGGRASRVRRVKAEVKRAVYRSGALDVFRRVRPATLTSVLFHRVLPASDPRSTTADPAYTMRLDTFERCLDALRAWYRPIAIGDVAGAVAGRTKLPRNALLVTFDDGWEDTARYAVPALQARNMPCLIFVTTGAIGREDVPWRDIVACAWRAGTLSAPFGAGTSGDGFQSLLQWLESLPVKERQAKLAKAINDAGSAVRPLMMSPETLRQLAEQGVGLGGHGVSHTPLTISNAVDRELRDCQAEFERLTGHAPTSFAFPHGLYTQPILEATQRAGFPLVFTSDRHLNRLRHGHPVSPVFGRISMSERDVTDEDGRFCPEKLAYWLTLQPVPASV